MLGLDLGPTTNQPYESAPQPPPTGGMDLLSGGLDQLLDLGGGPPPAQAPPNPMQTQMNQNPMGGGLLDLMGGGAPAPQAAPTTGLDALGNMGLFGSAAPPTVKSDKVMDRLQLPCNYLQF